MRSKLFNNSFPRHFFSLLSDVGQLHGRRFNVLFNVITGARWRYITEYGFVSIHIDCGKRLGAAVTPRYVIMNLWQISVRVQDTWIIAKILVVCFLYQLTAFMVVGTLYEYQVRAIQGLFGE